MTIDELILHIDVDAFFASVEQLLVPFLRGKPVIVGSGCIASCSYEARAFGLHAGMSLGQARKLCPGAIILEGNQHIYRCFAEHIWLVARRYTVGLETFLDEAYGDATGMDAVYGDALTLGRRLQQDVRTEVGLPVSVGLATNRMVAGIASHLAKPHGVAYVPPGTEAAFLGPLPIEELTGVGHKTASQLHDMNIRTVEELRVVPLATMSALFGRRGEVLYERCRGRDVAPPIQPAEAEADESVDYERVDEEEMLRPPEAVVCSSAPKGPEDLAGGVSPRIGTAQKEPRRGESALQQPHHQYERGNDLSPRRGSELQGPLSGGLRPRLNPVGPFGPEIQNNEWHQGQAGAAKPPKRPAPRSISRETTFHQPQCDLEHIRGMLFYLLERAMRTARSSGLMAGCVEVRIRYDDFKGDAASKSLPAPAEADDQVFPTVLELFARLHHRRVALRHVGVALSKFTPRGENRTLFDFEGSDRRQGLYQAMDEIRDRFGHAAVVSGKSIELLGQLDQNDHGFVLRTPSLTK